MIYAFARAVRRQPCNKRRPTRNFHRFVQSAEIVQALAQQITTGKQNRSFVVVLSPVVSIPTELEKLFVVVEHDLPGREQLEQIARGIATEEGELPDGDGPVLDGLIEVEKLTIVILSDESLGRGQHALRLAGFSGIPIPWGVKWGGAEQCRFLKNLLLQPVPNGPGLRLSTASTDLLRLGLQLDRDLEEHVRCPPLQVREQLRLPCLWAGFKPADAAGITGDGPELEAYSRRTGKSASRLLEGIRREYFGLVIYPFPWVSHHWRQAVSPPA